MHCAQDTRRHMSELIMMKPTVPQRVHPVTSCGPMQCHDLSGGRFGYLAQRHIGDQRKHHLHCMTKARRYVVESAPPDKPCRQHRQKAAGVDSGASVTDSVVCATHSHGRLTTSQDPKNMFWNASMLGRQFLRYECTGCDYIAEYVWKPLKYAGCTHDVRHAFVHHKPNKHRNPWKICEKCRFCTEKCSKTVSEPPRATWATWFFFMAPMSPSIFPTRVRKNSTGRHGRHLDHYNIKR